MFSEKCERAIKKALKLMEEEAPVYDSGAEFLNSSASATFWKLRLSGKKNEQFDVLFLLLQHIEWAFYNLHTQPSSLLKFRVNQIKLTFSLHLFFLQI